MKKILVIVLLALLAQPLLGGQAHDFPHDPPTDAPTSGIALNVRVDPSVELISIIFHLAGNREYNMGRIGNYQLAIRRHFRAHKHHPVVQLARALRIGFAEPMSLAVHLTNDGELKPRVPLDPKPENISPGWRQPQLREFIKQANAFAKASDFEKFFKDQQPFYDLSVKRMRELLAKEAHLDWFDDFFGATPGADFFIVVAPVNGPCNYGARFIQDGREELYSINGLWQDSPLGLSGPLFPKEMLPVVVHEFCHSYVNPVVYAHEGELEEAGKRLFPSVEAQMRRMAYGSWRSMMIESLVRASVVRYQFTHEGKEAGEKQIQEEVDSGFLWMRKLSELLIEYEEQRDRYPTFDTFFPRISELFNESSLEGLADMLAEDGELPQLVKLFPANGAEGVSPRLSELRVTFNVPMANSHSWMGSGQYFPTIREGRKIYWTSDRKTCVFPVRLKANWTYRLMLNNKTNTGFRSADGAALDPISYTFTTKK